MQSQDTDVHFIIDGLKLERGQIHKELEASLEKLPRGGTSVMDFSPHLEELVERAFVFGSLQFNSPKVRTGHLLLALVQSPTLQGILKRCSPTLSGISENLLSEQLGALTKDSAETASISDSEIERKRIFLEDAREDIVSKIWGERKRDF